MIEGAGKERCAPAAPMKKPPDSLGAGPRVNLSSRVPPGVAAAIAFLILGVVTLADIMTPGNVIFPILYSVAVAVAVWARIATFLWGLAILGTFLTFGPFLWGGQPFALGTENMAFTNRVLSALAIQIVAALGHFWIATGRHLEKEREALEKRNQELDAVNQELGQGRIQGAIAGFADISAQKALLREIEMRRREAEEASLRKTRFLAAVSHDIRTPANAIKLMAEIIRRSAREPAMAGKIEDLAHKLQENVASMLELVGDLLDIARFDTDKMELQESEFPLQDLIAGECKHLQPLAGEKGLSLVFVPPPWPVWLRSDRVKLARILGNLLGNAIKFTEKGGVKVEVRMPPDADRRVILEVSDTGIGIDAEHLPSLFDEFAQLRNPERDRAKGTGLGLAICKRLVSLIGGSINVKSRPHHGSTFTVNLPASAVALRTRALLLAQEAPPGAARITDRPLKGMRLLLVEDHQSSGEGVKQILEEKGAVVVEASRASVAFDILRRDWFEVVLLDMMLPDMDGREVLKALRDERKPGLRVVVLTADLAAERQEEVKRLGADFLIAKPVDVHKLVEALQALQRRE
jgi:signal transduction histidine kinase